MSSTGPSLTADADGPRCFIWSRKSGTLVQRLTYDSGEQEVKQRTRKLLQPERNHFASRLTKRDSALSQMAMSRNVSNVGRKRSAGRCLGEVSVVVAHVRRSRADLYSRLLSGLYHKFMGVW